MIISVPRYRCHTGEPKVMYVDVRGVCSRVDGGHLDSNRVMFLD